MHNKKNDFLEHSWGKSPEQKAREKEYNAEYYRKNKEKWAKYPKEFGDIFTGYISMKNTVKNKKAEAKASQALFTKHDSSARGIDSYQKRNSLNSAAQNEVSKALSREMSIAQLYYDKNEKAIADIGRVKANFFNKLYSSTLVKDLMNLFA